MLGQRFSICRKQIRSRRPLTLDGGVWAKYQCRFLDHLRPEVQSSDCLARSWWGHDVQLAFACFELLARNFNYIRLRRTQFTIELYIRKHA